MPAADEKITTPEPALIGEALELAELLRPTWSAISDSIPADAFRNEGDDEDEKVEIKKSELDELKRTVATKDREARDAKKQLGDLESKVDDLTHKLEDASIGDDEKAKLEKRMERLEKANEAAEERATKAEQKLESSTKQRTALEVATRLNFRNPSRAVRLLDPEDMESEADAERALEKVAREEPYLVTTKRQRDVEDPSKPKGGGGDDDEDDDDRENGDRGGKSKDEPKGPDRIRAYHEKQEAKRKKAEAAASSSSEDAD